MLVVISINEINKFPKNIVNDVNSDNPIIIQPAPYTFQLLSQNMNDFMCCGLANGDVTQFKNSGIAYSEVSDIPYGYEQRVLPPYYGTHLNIGQVTTGLMLENQALVKQRSDIDFIAIMADIDLEV